MVHLFGVTHGGHWIDFLGGHAGEVRMQPTNEFITELSLFPKGTRIGLEWMSDSDWEEVRSNINSLPFNPPEPRFSDQEPASRPRYESGSKNYWGELKKISNALGLETVFLEDKQIWFKYNEAMMRLAEGEARRRNLLVVERGESPKHYDRKRIGFNEERYREDIASRRIHEIERDNQLLKAIQSSKVDVVIAGCGHTDYWMVNSSVIQKNLGVEFQSYSAETPAGRLQPGNTLTKFEKNIRPNLGRAFTRTSLERAIRLSENGRLSDKNPNFVGTWDIHNPLGGYFEMFVNKEGSSIHGEIIDCLGDAEFRGQLVDDELRFVKVYAPDKCSEGASLDEISYKGIMRGRSVLGYFIISGFGSPFYATSRPIKATIDLGMSWGSSAKRYSKDIKLLGERLFENSPPVKPRAEAGPENSPF